MDITLRILDNIEMVLDETVDIGVGEMEIPGCSNDTARSLIKLVRQTLKFTASLSEVRSIDCVFCVPPDPSLTGGYIHEDGCVVNEARRLIERVEGGKE